MPAQKLHHDRKEYGVEDEAGIWLIEPSPTTKGAARVAAARLAERRGESVYVIEVGEDRDGSSRIVVDREEIRGRLLFRDRTVLWDLRSWDSEHVLISRYEAVVVGASCSHRHTLKYFSLLRAGLMEGRFLGEFIAVLPRAGAIIPAALMRRGRAARLSRQDLVDLSLDLRSGPGRLGGGPDVFGLRVGQQFDHFGHIYEIIKIGRDKNRTVEIARRHRDPFGKEAFIDHQWFPARLFDQQHLKLITTSRCSRSVRGCT